jgi:hypothetical protein
MEDEITIRKNLEKLVVNLFTKHSILTKKEVQKDTFLHPLVNEILNKKTKCIQNREYYILYFSGCSQQVMVDNEFEKQTVKASMDWSMIPTIFIQGYKQYFQDAQNVG